jgi:hypothetical protein
MKFGNAVKRSITSFLSGKMPDNMINETGEEIVFTPEYFDQMEKDLDISPAEQEDEDADT